MAAASVGVLVIATGRYLDFAAELCADIDEHLLPGREVIVNLFTDAPAAETDLLRGRCKVPLNIITVPPLRWPEASLYRYELFTEYAPRLVGDLLIYMDADIRIARSFLGEIAPERWPGQIAAVRHPGYYRARSVRPRGAWETSRLSTAYVPPWRRRQYVCGGVWMGVRASVLEVSAALAERVRRDAAAGVTARWHDESHWNWWVAHRKVHVLGPEYCWVSDYPWLANLEPVVCAVDKGGDFVREQTDDTTRQALTAVRVPEAGAPDQ